MVEAYHGSGVSIDSFKFDFVNQGADQLGSGFYFTNDVNEARAYAFATRNNEPKLGGDECPTVHRVNLRLTKPLSADFIKPLTKREVEQIIKVSPCLDECLLNFGEVDFEGYSKVFERAIRSYIGHDTTPLLETLSKLAVDFYGDYIEEFNRAVHTVLKYDGVIKVSENNTHYVAWFPEQITILEKVPMHMDAPLAVASTSRKIKAGS